ncbi:DNA-directed DNA polymerase [Aeromonas phage AhFM11]|nr:DNA-directed DNA polymerase [Aeromonas phage AhFM11]
MHYTNIEIIGNNVCERYVENGVTKTRRVPYQPTLFVHGMAGRETKHKDIYGRYCEARKFENLFEARKWKKTQEDVGIEVLGMDDFNLTYISDTYKGIIEFDRDDVVIDIVDIEVTAPEFPDPKFAKYAIDLISHTRLYKGKRIRYVFDLVTDVGHWDPKKSVLGQSVLDEIVYMPFETEEDLLLNYIQLWRTQVPDLVFGWNSEGFDIPYIITRITNLFGETIANKLSPYGKITSKTINNAYGEKIIYKIHGIALIDYMDVFKKFSFTVMASYALGNVGQAEGVGDKLEYDGPINKFRAADHQRYVDYCVRDTDIILLIDDGRCFIDLILSMSYYAKIKFEDVLGTIKPWDSIIFNSLASQNVVIPAMRHQATQSFPGAFVKEPVPGGVRYGMSFDLTSLYPSILRLLNLSPEMIAGMFAPARIEDYINKIAPQPSTEHSCAPNGMMYKRGVVGVLPTETEKVFNQRKSEKKMMLAAKRNKEVILKILASRV